MMTDEQIKNLSDEQIRQLTLDELEWLQTNKKHLLDGCQLMVCWFTKQSLEINGVAGEVVSVSESERIEQPKRELSKDKIICSGRFLPAEYIPMYGGWDLH